MALHCSTYRQLGPVEITDKTKGEKLKSKQYIVQDALLVTVQKCPHHCLWPRIQPSQATGGVFGVALSSVDSHRHTGVYDTPGTVFSLDN